MSLIGNLWLETKIRMRHSFLPQLFYTIYRACAPHQSSEQNLALPDCCRREAPATSWERCGRETMSSKMMSSLFGKRKGKTNLSLDDFLKKCNLEKIKEPLETQGVAKLEDFAYLEVDNFRELGLAKVELRRLGDYLKTTARLEKAALVAEEAANSMTTTSSPATVTKPPPEAAGNLKMAADAETSGAKAGALERSYSYGEVSENFSACAARFLHPPAPIHA